MKIGIITMHRVPNYGSFLQTYATQFVFNKLGFENEIIDYQFPNEFHFAKGRTRANFIIVILLRLLKPFNILKSLRKERNLKNALCKYCNLSDKYYKSYTSLNEVLPLYDVYVTGSDQTWNPEHTCGDKHFLLDFAPRNAKKISFSASMACKKLTTEDAELYSKYLGEFSAIAVREKNSVDFLEKLVDKKVSVTLDPTLMLNKEEWLSAFSSEKLRILPEKYIVIYPVTYSFNPFPYFYEILHRLQQETGLKIVSFIRISSDIELDVQYVRDANVREFVEIFANASYVITSSFHGTAFALNFGIPLYAIVPDDYATRDSRQVDILKLLGVEQCLVPIGKPFEEINPTYDATECQYRLNEERAKSLNYLRDALK